jgi:putative exporter of polyketide antibiotics
MAQRKKHHLKSKDHYRFWGILFILAGVVIFLDSAEFLDFGMIFHRYWPVILMTIGILLLTREQPNLVGGSILLLFGIYFQLVELEWLYYPYKAYFFSAALIILGGIFLYHASRKEKEIQEHIPASPGGDTSNNIQNTSQPPNQP